MPIGRTKKYALEVSPLYISQLTNPHTVSLNPSNVHFQTTLGLVYVIKGVDNSLLNILLMGFVFVVSMVADFADFRH